jgi:hypothetical protein
MSFNRENLTIVTNSLKNGIVPSLFAYYNEDNDTITGADFFDDRRLRLGDQLMVFSADKSKVTFYRVSAVTIKAGTATVLASSQSTPVVYVGDNWRMFAVGNVLTTQYSIDDFVTILYEDAKVAE